MIADPSTREGRVAMLKQGYSEREIGHIYNQFRGYVIINSNLLFQWAAMKP